MSLADVRVAVTPDLRQFGSQLLTDAAVAGRRAGSAAGNEFSEQYSRDANGRLRDARGRFVSEAKVAGALAGHAGGEAFSGAYERNAEGRMQTGQMVAAGKTAGGLAGRAAGNNFADEFGDRVKRAIVTHLGALAALAATKWAAIGAGAVLATPAVLGLASALAQVSGIAIAAPAAFGAMAVAGGVTAMAMHGLGDAVKAVLDGDPEAIAEAFKKIAPSAQDVALAIGELAPRFRELQQAVQQRVWLDLGDLIRQLGNQWLPMLRERLAEVAAGMNSFAQLTLRAAQSTVLMQGVSDLMRATAIAIRDAGGASAYLANAFGILLSAGSTLIDEFGAGFTDLARRFNAFISEANRTGQLVEWMDVAVQRIAQLGRILGNVLSIFGSLFRISNDYGLSFLDTLERLTGQAATWLKTAEGSRVIGEIFQTIADAGGFVWDIFTTLAPAAWELFRAFSPLTDTVRDLAKVLAGGIAGIIREIAPQIRTLAETLATKLNPLVKDLKDLIDELSPKIGDLVKSLVELAILVLPVLIDALRLVVNGLTEVTDALGPDVVQALTYAAVGFFGLKWAVEGTTAAVVGLKKALEGGGIAGALRLLTNPVTGAIAVVIGLGLAFYFAYTHSDTFREKTDNAFRTYKKSAEDTGVAARPFVEQLKEIATEAGVRAVDGVLRLADGFRQVREAIGEGLSSTFGPFMGQMRELGQKIAPDVRWAMDRVGEGVLAVGGFVRQAADNFGFLIGLFDRLAHDLAPAVRWGFDRINEATGPFKGFLSDLGNSLGPLAQIVLDALGNALRGVGEAANQAYDNMSFLFNVFQFLVDGVVLPAMNRAVEGFRLGSQAMQTIATTAYNAIREGAQLMALGIQLAGQTIDFAHGMIGASLQRLRDAFFVAWEFIRGIVNDVWTNVLWPIYNGIASVIDNVVRPGLQRLIDSFNFAWNFIRNIVNDVWTNVLWPVHNTIAWVIDNVVRPAKQRMMDSFNYAWNFMRNVVNDGWNFIRGLWEQMAHFADTILPSAVQNGVNAIGSAWDRIKGLFAGPFMWVVTNVINKLIDVWDKVAGALGGKTIGKVNVSVEGFGAAAEGAVLPGFAPRRDTIPYMLSAGESVLVPELTRAIGPKNIMALNRAARARTLSYAASGAVVGSSLNTHDRKGGPDFSFLMEIMSNPVGYFASKIDSFINQIVPRFGDNHITRTLEAGSKTLVQLAGSKVQELIAALFPFGGSGDSIALLTQLVARAGYPFQVTSGYRPGSITKSGNLSYHARHMAIDVVSPNMVGIAKFLMTKAQYLLELIHSGGGGYFVHNGKVVGADVYRDVIGEHFDHVHVAATPAGAAGALGISLGGAGGAAPAWLLPILQAAVAITGVGPSWIAPLITLIGRESGFNPRAINLTDSNAARGDPSRGLMQTIGATFNAYRLPSLSGDIYDPLSNVVAGIRYILARYGTIFNVQQAVGATPRGYDKGGILPPGATLALNGTGRNEYVSTGNDMDDVKALLRELIGAVDRVAPGVGGALSGSARTMKIGGRQHV